MIEKRRDAKAEVVRAEALIEAEALRLFAKAKMLMHEVKMGSPYARVKLNEAVFNVCGYNSPAGLKMRISECESRSAAHYSIGATSLRSNPNNNNNNNTK